MNIKRFNILLLMGVVISAVYFSCKDGGINIFTVQQDIELGAQLRDEILSNPTQYPVLDRTQYAAAYAYVESIKNELLTSDEFNHKDDFEWEVYIIDDEVLNAFCAPGGYIFVYTGLIKFLDVKDHFVGVLGHEMAHADRRHSTDQMTTQYGLSVLLDVVLGTNRSQLGDMAAGLSLLGFSRSMEKEADEYSVKYLCDTQYSAEGTAGFFQKLIDSGQGSQGPAFLSTHPNPDNRIQNITTQAADDNCDVTYDSDQADWDNFRNNLIP